MVPIVAPGTGTVVIGETIASVLPAGIMTLVGVWAWGKSLAMVTSAPPAGAGMFSVTRAWVGLPPETLPGSAMIQKISRPGGVGDATTVKLAVADHGFDAGQRVLENRPRSHHQLADDARLPRPLPGNDRSSRPAGVARLR